MCTVTVIPMRSGYRLLTNRDESRDRAAATPPAVRTTSGGRPAIWPIDAAAGGTWVGVSASGLGLTLLNLNLDPPPPLSAQPQSRGALIPAIIDAQTAADAIDALPRTVVEHVAPFRLVAVDTTSIVVARWNRTSLDVQHQPLEPVCLASSGLGDHLVQERVPLFAQMLDEHGPTPAMQDAFHQHTWPGREAISVMMSRDDARTVSTTGFLVAPDGIEMWYRDDAGSHAPVRMQMSTPEHTSCSRP
jgi:hypothetical protein